MSSVIGAKRSVAMKACIKLHELGALTDDLKPVYPNTILNLTDSSLFPNWIEEKDYMSVPGTYKKRREHKLEASEHFYRNEIIHVNCDISLITIYNSYFSVYLIKN